MDEVGPYELINNNLKDDAMTQAAIKAVNEGMDKHAKEKDIATYVKHAFDEQYGGTWHCIFGNDFGVSVSQENKCLLFAKIGANGEQKKFLLLFKSFDEKEHIMKKLAADPNHFN